MKYPVLLRARKNGPVLAKIYKPAPAYPRYRLAWTVGGKRMMKAFPTYSAAKRHGDGMLGDLAKGSQVTLLTPAQANDALAALERLQSFYASTGRKVSLLAGISAYCEAAVKLGDRSLSDSVDGFLSNVATVKRIDLAEAVEEYITLREKETVLKKDEIRPALSPSYHYIVAMWLREVAKTFPNTVVCDLTKDLLNKYMEQHGEVSSRTRNGRRTVLGMFLKWSVRKDYLAGNHRLLEADGMTPEDYQPEEIEYYRPEELARILKTASAHDEYRPLLPVLALCGLAGIRLQEVVRLTWEDVFRVKHCVEISATKSKTRARRLVTACPALRKWLAPYRACSGPVWGAGLDKFHDGFGMLRGGLGISPRRNGFRHAFVTYHFALHSNENLTAAEAGNTPDMIHAHYKGLGTKAEALKWFAVRPAKAGNIVPIESAAVV